MEVDVFDNPGLSETIFPPFGLHWLFDVTFFGALVLITLLVLGGTLVVSFFAGRNAVKNQYAVIFGAPVLGLAYACLVAANTGTDSYGWTKIKHFIVLFVVALLLLIFAVMQRGDKEANAEAAAKGEVQKGLTTGELFSPLAIYYYCIAALIGYASMVLVTNALFVSGVWTVMKAVALVLGLLCIPLWLLLWRRDRKFFAKKDNRGARFNALDWPFVRLKTRTWFGELKPRRETAEERSEREAEEARARHEGGGPAKATKAAKKAAPAKATPAKATPAKKTAPAKAAPAGSTDDTVDLSGSLPAKKTAPPAAT